MARTVLLQHATPDGDHHFDWLLETEGESPVVGPDSPVLLAWRLADPPAPGLACEAIRLPPHRLLYLHYEGPVRDLGVVRRVSSGCVLELVEDDSRLMARLDLDGRELVAVGTRIEGSRWELRFDSDAGAP